MKLNKIILSVIPTMYNKPCKIAVFTVGNRVAKVFQKDFGNWYRNKNLECFETLASLEKKIAEINEEGNAVLL